MTGALLNTHAGTAARSKRLAGSPDVGGRCWWALLVGVVGGRDQTVDDERGTTSSFPFFPRSGRGNIVIQLQAPGWRPGLSGNQSASFFQVLSVSNLTTRRVPSLA